MSNSRIALIRRLFAPKVYNPKSMFYLAYKSARLNGVSFSRLPKKIRKMQHDMDTQIIACGEDIDHTLAIEELEKWDWTQQKRLPFQLFLAAMHLKEIPDWLDETMLIESVYYFKELINYRDPYDTDEFNTWNMNGKPFKTIWKICKFCYTNCEDPDEYRFMFNRTVFAEDAEEIVQRFQDESSWCEICHTCPLFNISVIYENSPNNKRKCSSSSDDEDIISDSFYVKHPKAEN
ncbi:nonstructural protein NS3 [Pseudoplusia includens densovirus]|uniref:Nonstructural protein NS3 n=1 Tax=Pseudoplusia includens densovirus TaxID=185637 RepID=K7SA37_JCDNV|nr:nonstructural protein NS3 [Pseudoplusia includens densovirus]AFV91529.1 nonstructural protein NS3 [Pseudoplusia includens densovirus]